MLNPLFEQILAPVKPKMKRADYCEKHGCLCKEECEKVCYLIECEDDYDERDDHE